jgi:GNAT superfamily N-acetyltransferase
MIIRDAGLSDAAVIVDFNLALAAESEALVLERDCVGAGVDALLRDANKGRYYVAEKDGLVVGQVMITYEWSDWRNATIWWLQSVYVRPDHRGKGVFTALFGHLRDLAFRAQQVCGVRLYMHQANEQARAVYERLGLHQTEYRVFEWSFPNQPHGF